jgi:hypothetical protein
VTRVHVLPCASLAELGDALKGCDDDDLVLVHPAGAALVAAGPDDVAAAGDLFGGAVAVAASPTPLAAPSLTARLATVLEEQLGALPHRAYPHPLGLCGPVRALRAVLDGLPPGGSDADRLTELLLAGGADLALDVGGQVFRVLDGSGADVTAVAGRLHAGGERPVVAIGSAAALSVLKAALDDPGSRDLAALLRYDGAVDSSGDLVEMAPEIVVMPFWTREFCASVIRAAEASGVWAADPDDPVPGSEVSLYAISPRLVGRLEEDLRARVWPRWRSHWGEAAETGILDAFVIRYEPGGAGRAELPLHHDLAQISASVRLNTAFSGGALSFPRQSWDTSAVPVGHLVAWPSLVTHPHRAEPVTGGVKYGLTIWIRLPEG